MRTAIRPGLPGARESNADVDVRALEDALRRTVRGEVRFDALDRRHQAHASGLLQVLTSNRRVLVEPGCQPSGKLQVRHHDPVAQRRSRVVAYSSSHAADI
jgi:hypothetical protein